MHTSNLDVEFTDAMYRASGNSPHVLPLVRKVYSGIPLTASELVQLERIAIRY